MPQDRPWLYEAIPVEDDIPEAPRGYGEALQGAEISPTPAIQKEIPLMPWLPQGTPQPHLPSPVNLMEALPGVGGALGAALGRVGGPPGRAIGGALGGGGGEAIRQLLRRLSGLPAAAGFGQEAAGLDPNSAEAAALGIFNEALAGAGGELGATKVVKGAPALKARGQKRMIDALTGDSPAAIKEDVAEAIAPVVEDLPGPGLNPFRARRRMADILAKKAEAAGEKVGARYRTGEVIDPDEVSTIKKALEESADAQAFTPAQDITRMTDTGDIVEDVIPATYSSETKRETAQALGKRARNLGAKLAAKEDLVVDFTLADLHELRRGAAEDAKKASREAFKFGAPTGPESGKALAALKERGLISDLMHAKTPAVGVKGQAGYIPSGQEVDDIFHAYKTAQEYAEGAKEPSHFVERWLLSGMVGGKFGKAVGGIAQTASFWSALRGKTYTKLAKLLEAGKEAEAEHIIRGLFATAKGAPGEEEEEE